ncbi:TetR/AcrR family transcriptional regulator [Novosphingobium beihaiensis]|uniref:TetR/AcrR family transcriptional regulator n=1 Tax=Novosphingobium beihaiensis TaxID=2930389 RepID=A0ABT0BUW5_9SPHN|nr:TetR/AcrR family transcriptional regulator [Novosphingobium beihaiensis]MCJ2188839.1 TetR/AcrR family transcriptional regulator [Novosphingobium beihaiensis]
MRFAIDAGSLPETIAMPELKPVFSQPDARDLILEAALAAFAERGFHGATMRDIAARAEVSQSLVQYHFKGKEALWTMVGERISADFLDDISQDISPDLPPDEGVVRAIRRYMAYWRGHPQAFRFNLWRLLEGPPEERRKRSKALNRQAVPVFQRAQEAGFLRDDMPAGLAMIVTGALVQFWLHSQTEIRDALAVTGDGPLEDEAFLESLVGLIRSVPGDCGRPC